MVTVAEVQHALNSCAVWSAFERQPGNPTPWLDATEQLKFYNIVFCLDHDKQHVLLGFKKRGVCMNLWTGFGGKLEPGESNVQAAYRELHEESCLAAQALDHVGFVMFVEEGRARSDAIDCYVCSSWTGTPQETDEMRPQWFSFASFMNPDAQDSAEPLPLSSMPPEIAQLLPYVLRKLPQRFVARADFPKPGVDDDSMLKSLIVAAPPDFLRESNLQ